MRTRTAGRCTNTPILTAPTAAQPEVGHRHRHLRLLRLGGRPFLLGIVHGMAGSAALMLLTLAAIPSAVGALVYVLVFGLGSTLGMLVLSGLMGVPLALSAGRSRVAQVVLQVLAGSASLLLGLWIAYRAHDELTAAGPAAASAPASSRLAHPPGVGQDTAIRTTPGSTPAGGLMAAGSRPARRSTMPDAVIVSTARTPIGKAYRGAFNNTHGATLTGHVIAHAVKRAGLEPDEVEDVIIGCAMPEGATGQNIARQAALRAGCPVTTAGVTVNRFCSSGLQAISMAAQRVIVDRVPVVVAGGVESISLVQNEHQNKHRVREAWIDTHKPELYMSMIETAEVVARRYYITREAQDEYALASQQRTAAAQKAGRFDAEIVPLTTTKLVEDKATKEIREEEVTLDPGRGESPGHRRRGPGRAQAGDGRERASSPRATRASSPTAPPPAW